MEATLMVPKSSSKSSNSATPGATVKLSRFARGIDLIRTETGYSDMPIQMVAFLLECTGTTEIALQEVMKRAGVSQSASVRLHQKLGAGRPVRPGESGGVEGLGLLEVYPDPYYQKRSMVRLTPKGHRLILKLLEAL
jgi:DNA-binding MarR family transcriptional regulator